MRAIRRGARLSLCSFLATALLLHGLVRAADLATLEPVDEAIQQPDFLAFRNNLRTTIARRDVNALLRVVHPNIKNTFGDDNGIEAFKRLWRLDQPDSELWHELGEVLRLGGTFDSPDSFVAPYVFSRWPDDVDAFEHVAVIGSNVRVRAAPSTRSRILTTVSYSILRLGGDKGYPQEPWTTVALPDGRTGFVAAYLVRSSVDYRAYFVRTDGQWQMAVLIAGD
jgi:hypothetical protein